MSAKVGKFYMDRLYALDNFSSFSLRINEYFEQQGVHLGTVMTVEHAYQALKFLGPIDNFEIPEDLIERNAFFISLNVVPSSIISAPSSHEAKDIAHEKSENKRKDWSDVKEVVMEKLLRLKFEQHQYVRKTLARSFGQELVENSPNDGFWGIAWRDGGRGQNKLGEIWMKIQKEHEKSIREEFPEDFGLYLNAA